jgi:fucose 4-O-acetylase-like acetyltransferase
MSGAKPLLAPDLLKAFGIVLVVFGHVLRGLDTSGILPDAEPWISIDRLIYLFHMPLFFYAAGLFLHPMYEKYGWGGLIRRSALALLAPLVVWSYLQFSLQYAAGGSANYERGLEYVLAGPFPPRQQFWFLFVLFVLTVTVPFLFRLRESRKIMWMLTAVTLLMQAVFWNDIVRIMAIGTPAYLVMQTFVHLPFFLLGILLPTEKMGSFPVSFWAAVAVFVLALAVYQFLPDPFGFVHMVTSVLCVLSAYKIALDLTKERNGGGRVLSAILFVGMNSMIIYLAHVICMALMRVVLLKLGVESAALHISAGLLAGVLLPLLLVPVGLVWAKHQPNLARAVLPVRMERK